MRFRASAICVTIVVILGSALWCQEPEPGGPEGQQRLAQLRAAIAANRAKLQKYQWVQTTEVRIKGEVKKEQQQMCRIGPDGKIEKTPIGPPPAQPNIPTSGLKGKIAGKKVAEMQDYTERLKSLISHYAPPDPQIIKAAAQNGTPETNVSGGLATITLSNYYKPGDKVTFAFDAAQKKLQSYDVNTYLDNPKDVVILKNQFSSLPDGTNYLQQSFLSAQAKQITITTTNANHTPIAQ